MDRESLLDMIEEELKVASEMGYEFRRTAENVLAIVEGEREHLDYNEKEHKYNWEED